MYDPANARSTSGCISVEAWWLEEELGYAILVLVLVVAGHMAEMVYNRPMAEMVYGRLMARVYKKDRSLLGIPSCHSRQVVSLPRGRERAAAVGGLVTMNETVNWGSRLLKVARSRPHRSIGLDAKKDLSRSRKSQQRQIVRRNEMSSARNEP